MKILVCIKQVPDTETRVKVAADGRSLDETGVKMIISPYDEFALEEALLLKESGGGEVVVVTAGRDSAQETLRRALAMGADRAILVHHDGYERADALCRADALAAVAKAESPDLVFTGKFGVGADDGLTGPMTAAMLDWPHAANVFRLETTSDGFRAWRGVEGAVEVLESRRPGVVTWDKGEHEPRYASLKGIMAAKKKPLAVKSPADLGLPEPPSKGVVWESMELPPARGAGRILDGDPAEAAKELVRLLHEEAKVI